MASDRVATRRLYDDELKAQVVAECEAPEAWVAKVAMMHGINANVVHRWLAATGAQGASTGSHPHPRPQASSSQCRLYRHAFQRQSATSRSSCAVAPPR
jgi:transposase-like protein